MVEEQQHSLSPEEEEDADLEFKPVVKYTALGLVLCAFLGLSWATFHLGYSQGYNEAVSSQQVAEKLNAAAARQVAHFMQSSSIDDAELQKLAADAESKLAWIADEQIRREALWSLAQTLLNRRMGDQAAPLLDNLFDTAPTEPVWLRRMLLTGDAYFAAQDPATAAAWYRRAADASQGRDKLDALGKLFAAQSLRGIGCAELLKELESADARPLKMVILTYLGESARIRGEEEKAHAYFEKACATAPEPEKLAADELIYYATALASKGESAKALELLQQALSCLEHRPEMLPARLLGLRQAATATMSVRNDAHAALALLNRAEGAAEGELPADNPFRSCLAEQRGWLLLLTQEHAAALAEFRSAMNTPANALISVQAMEGAARCHLALNQAKEAQDLLRRCAELREKLNTEDTASAGRVHLLLAQAEEQQGNSEGALSAYKRAATLLSEAGDNDNLITALFGYGYGLMKATAWTEALTICQQLAPLVRDKPDRREEARHMLNTCRAHNKLPLPIDDSAAPQETARAAAIEAAAEAEEADEEEQAAVDNAPVSS